MIVKIDIGYKIFLEKYVLCLFIHLFWASYIFLLDLYT